MIVNGILFYFLFINLPDCDLAELEAAKYPIIINPKYENKNTIIPTKDTLSSNDKFFWQSQLYDEMRNSHKKILAQIDKQIDTSIMKLIESVEKSIQEINHKVQSFYLRLGSAQDMELAMPNDRGKRRTLTAPFPTPRISITTRNRGIGWFRPEGAPGIKSRCNSSTNHLTPKPP